MNITIIEVVNTKETLLLLESIIKKSYHKLNIIENINNENVIVSINYQSNIQYISLITNKLLVKPYNKIYLIVRDINNIIELFNNEFYHINNNNDKIKSIILFNYNIELFLYESSTSNIDIMNVIKSFSYISSSNKLSYNSKEVIISTAINWYNNKQNITKNKESNRRASIKPKTKINLSNNLGKRIPTIYPSLLSYNQYQNITANSPYPIPFNTELFNGKVLLLINTKNPDNLYKERFEGTKYTFEVQIQGRFNVIPQGYMFFGAEISKKMELGLFTRGLCSSIIQLARTIQPFLHHSFGDKNNSEYPHIAIPVWSAVDRLVINDIDDINIPTLGKVIPEDLTERQIRRKNPNFNVNVDVNKIYTLSFKTSNIDLVDWKLMNLPIMKSMDLHTFWNDADIRMMAYCIPYNSTSGKSGLGNSSSSSTESSVNFPKQHLSKDLNIWFSLEIKHKSNHVEYTQLPIGLDKLDSCTDLKSESKIEKDFEDDFENEIDNISDSNDSIIESDSDEEINFSDIDDDSAYFDTTGQLDKFDRNLYIKTVNSSIDSSVTKIDNTNKSKKTLTNLLVDNYIESSLDKSTSNVITSPMYKVVSPPISPTQSSSRYIDINLVISVFEIDDRRSGRHNSRRTCYAFLVDPWKHMLSSNCEKICVLRTYKEWISVLPFKKPDPRPLNYSRLSEPERRRLELDFSYKDIYKKIVNNQPKLTMKLNNFLVGGPHTDNLLNSSSSSTTTDKNGFISSTKLRSDLPDFIFESLVCVQLSNHYWSEEYMGLISYPTNSVSNYSQNLYYDLIFIKPSNKLTGKKSRLIINLMSIISIQPINNELNNYLSFNKAFKYLTIHTLSKKYLIMLQDETIRNKWIEILNQCIDSLTYNQSANLFNSSRKSSIVKSTKSMKYIDKHHLNLLIRPKSWVLNDREILNGRSFTKYIYEHLRIGSSSDMITDKLIEKTIAFKFTNWLKYLPNPITFVEKLLMKTFMLCKLMNNDNGDTFDNNNTANSNIIKNNSKLDELGFPSNFSSNFDRQTDKTYDKNIDQNIIENLMDLSPSLVNHWIDFLDGVSLLQSIELSTELVITNTPPLAQDELLCIMLNLYHIMLLHGFLVMGVPDSVFKWGKFFGTVAYEAFGDIFSLVELEHCIIRYGMSKPNINFVAQTFIPSSRYNFSITKRDFRLLWALNCGSESLAPFVPIYRPEVLDSQLDVIVSLSLDKQLYVVDNTVFLPQLCQWYNKDFEYTTEGLPLISSSSPNSFKAILNVLSKFCRGEKEEQIFNLLSAKKNFKISFSPFNFRCRYLEPFGANDDGIDNQL